MAPLVRLTVTIEGLRAPIDYLGGYRLARAILNPAITSPP
jgi:hypothetical protein